MATSAISLLDSYDEIIAALQRKAKQEIKP